MKKYIINDVEYTLDQISSAANDNGVDIDTYINDMGAQVVTDTVEQPVEKPTAVVEGTAPAAANMDLQSENGSLDLLEVNEISLEEKRQLPFGVSQHLLRNNKKFTRENIDQANLKLEEQKNKGFDDHVEDLKEAIVGNGVERFKNWSYNIFGADGIGGIAGPSTLSRFQQASAAFAIAMDKINNTKESEDKAKEELKTLSGLQDMQKPTPSIVDDDSEGLLGAIAGLVGDTTQVAQSVIPTTVASFGGGLAGGAVGGPAGAAAGATTGAIASTALQIMPSFITDYNVIKAEEKYKDEGLSQEEAVNKLIEEDEAEMLVPLVGASIAMIPEYIGFKGINKYLMTSTAGKSIMAKVARLALTSNKEGLTEVVQLFPEGVNSALAAGENLDDAVVEGLQYTFENAKDTFISSAAGTAAFGLGGKALKKGKNRLWRKNRNMRAAIDGGKMEALVDEISDLNVKRMEANEPELKEALSEQIKTKVQELESLDAKANSIMSFAEDSEFEKITELEDLKRKYINKVKNIQNKKEELDPKEYGESLNIYKEKYLEAQNRIKGISESVQAKAEKATPEDVAERTVKNANAINNAFNSETMQRVNEKTGKKELTAKGLEFFHNVLVPNMSDLVTAIANRKFRENKEFGESKYKKEDFIADLLYAPERNKASSLIGLLTSFNPEKNKFLTKYITDFFEDRSKRILEERVGSQATIGGTSIDTQEARELAGEDIDVEVSSTKGPRFAKRLGLSDELINKVRNAAKKALSTAKKVDDKKFLSDLVNTINSEIFDDIRNLIPKPKEREAFMEQFAGTIWDAMPQSSMAKATRNETFQSWGIEAPTKEAFVDYFLGRDQEGLGDSTINDRAKKQLPQYLAKAIGAEYAQDLLENDPDTRERFGLTQKQEVEDAADEIQGKTKEERELQNTAPKELEELRRLADEGDAGNINEILGGERVSVDNTNSKNNYEKLTKRQKAILNFVKIAKIPSILLQKAGFASPGAEYTTKNGVTYYKLKNGKEVKKGTPEFKKAQEENLILPRQKKGGLFSSTNDGFLKQAMEIAKENDKLYPELSLKRVRIPRGTRLDKNFVKKHAQRAKQNMDVLITSMKILTDAVHKHNLPLEDAFLFIASGYQATDGFIKAAAPFKYISKSFAYGRSLKQVIGEEYREEHQPPASYIGKIMMWAIKNNKADLIEPFIRKNYYQTQLSKADDQKIDDAKLDSGMPKGYLIFENPIIRMAESGVNLNDQFNIETGQTMAQEFDAESAETPDAIAASNEVVKEKLEDNIETLIDRAIGKLEDYLGPKGALQANFAAVPINILIGGLRATKLAYKGSKNLAKALEAGYKKVQDYMSQQEWLDFAKQAVTEVKKEPTGATIALAIANENAIKNEQNRINKLNVLNKAKNKKVLYTTPNPSGKPSAEKKVVFLVGAAGSGKSTLTKQLGFKEQGFTVINRDTELERLTKEAGLPTDMRKFTPKQRDQWREMQYKAAEKSTDDIAALRSKGKGVVIDEAGSSEAAIMRNLREFKKAGYDVQMVFVESSLDIALERNKNRTERSLTDTTVKNSFEAVMKNKKRFSEMFKENFVEVNTNKLGINEMPSPSITSKINQFTKGKAEGQQAKFVEENKNKSSQQINEELKKLDEQKRKEKQSEGLERNFRRILNIQKKKGKKPSKWFIPSNAEDIKGLLYAFLPDGAAGVAAKKFFNSTILKPYSDAVAAAEAEILQLSKKFVEIKEQAKVKLDENIKGTPYTMGDAIKVYNWVKAGVDVDVLKQEYLDRMIGAVEANAEAKYLANEIAANYDITYDKNWRGIPLNKSIYDAIQKGTRTKHLQTFSQNVDAIFNKDNLQEIENVFGKSYVQALQNSLKRMRSGRNRVSTDAQSNKFLNWINKSVATTMFFNTRSAALQLLSSLNFIGQKDNNLFKATAAFANQKQWQEDYNKLWNSDYLSNRRDGAKFDVLADEIAEDQESFLNKLLQKGFLPTRYADSFAIALGGAAFYRNRVNALMKEGMSKEDAETQALKDWQDSAEETQQSSDPSKISEIQASSIGKIIYAFANTPFQYARKGKRLLQDVASGRSKAEGGMNQVRKDLQSVFYYTVGQAMLFNALQTALFASMFSDDEEDKLEEKTITAIERILTSYAKSLGNPGAVIGSIYSVLAEANEQIEKRGRIDNAYKLALEATAISPPLNTKLKDIVAIGNIYKYNHKQIEKDPFEVKLDNPVLEIAGNAASFAGYPLDRVIRKAQNLEAVMNEQTEAWEKVFLTLGWSKWELGIDIEDNKFKKPNFKKPEFEKPEFEKPKFEKPDFESPNKKLENGVAGRANNDGTIEIDPNLSPVEREITIAHEKQHMKDMDSGKLNYDDNYVYWNGGKYERKDGKIKYKGKSYIEGHKDLPWEKVAYAAEPSKSAVKRKLYE